MKKHPQFHAESGLLKVLDARFKSLSLGDGKSHKKPDYGADLYAKVVLHMAADAHAKVNVSDPFARGRIMLHMKQGYELPSDVLAEANSKLKVRADARNSNTYEAAA